MSPTATLVKTQVNTNGHVAMNTAVNGAGSRRSPHQYRQTVRQFFEQLNWNGLPPLPAASGTTTATAVSLSYTLSIKEFCERFPWEGIPTVAASTRESTADLDMDALLDGLEEGSGEDDVTLDDFSGLFG